MGSGTYGDIFEGRRFTLMKCNGWFSLFSVDCSGEKGCFILLPVVLDIFFLNVGTESGEHILHIAEATLPVTGTTGSSIVRTVSTVAGTRYSVPRTYSTRYRYYLECSTVLPVLAVCFPRPFPLFVQRDWQRAQKNTSNVK